MINVGYSFQLGKNSNVWDISLFWQIYVWISKVKHFQSERNICFVHLCFMIHKIHILYKISNRPQVLNVLIKLVILDWFVIQGNNPLVNPHGDPMCSQPIMPIQQTVADLLFSRGGYVKKLIEDCNNSDETTKLLKVWYLIQALWTFCHMTVVWKYSTLNENYNFLKEKLHFQPVDRRLQYNEQNRWNLKKFSQKENHCPLCYIKIFVLFLTPWGLLCF